MISLHPTERVLLTIRRHWYVYVGPAVFFVLFLVIPPLALVFAPQYFPVLATAEFSPVLDFFFALYVMAMLTVILIFWVAHYLDVWIITDERVIDIEQHGLFHREISEIPMERIQNVTIEIPGLLPTLLKFGNLKIQTASEGEFTITDVPHCYEAKDLILQYSRASSAVRT